MFEVKRFAWVFAMLTTVACGGAGDDAAESGESDEIESALHGGERYSYRGYWARGLEREAGRVVFVREGGLPVFGPNDFLQDSMAASVIAFRAPATLGGGVRVIHADMKCYNQYDPSVTCRVYADDQYGEHWYFDFHRNVDGRPGPPHRVQRRRRNVLDDLRTGPPRPRNPTATARSRSAVRARAERDAISPSTRRLTSDVPRASPERA